MQNIPSLNLSLGWTSLIGAITLLILQVGFNCNLVVISSMIRIIIDRSQIFYVMCKIQRIFEWMILTFVHVG